MARQDGRRYRKYRTARQTPDSVNCVNGGGNVGHGGEPPLVLFVFETPDDEDAFQDAASWVDHAPFASSNLETIAQQGILADTWLPPAPEPWERLQLQELVRLQCFR